MNKENKLSNQTVYIVDDHNLVGDPSLEWYTADEFKECIEYFER